MATRREAVRFEVSINDGDSVVAGVRHGVLSTVVTWVRRNPERWHGHGTLDEWSAEALTLNVGGIDGTTDEFIDWIKEQSLSKGDEVTITVLGPGECDEPIRRHSWTEQSLRFQHLKRLLEFLRPLAGKMPDRTFGLDSSQVVTFVSILLAFEAKHPDLVLELRPTDAIVASQFLERAERLLAVVDIPEHQE